jgi:hypothetical protein
MICPRCTSRHALGADRCQNCGYPFTRRAARRSARGGGFNPPPTADARPDYGPSPEPQAGARSSPVHQDPPRRHARSKREPRTYYRSQGPGNRAIGGLIAVLIVAIVVIAAAAALSNSNVTSTITNDVADRAGQLIGVDSDDEPPVEVPEVSDEPAGNATWVLTQEELNNRIAARAGSFGPVRDVHVELNDGSIAVRFRAHGINGTYHGSLIAQNGTPVIADSTIDGPLGWVVSSSQIDDVLNDEIAKAVAEQDISVESVHVQPGQLVFGVSG